MIFCRRSGMVDGIGTCVYASRAYPFQMLTQNNMLISEFGRLNEVAPNEKYVP